MPWTWVCIDIGRHPANGCFMVLIHFPPSRGVVAWEVSLFQYTPIERTTVGGCWKQYCAKTNPGDSCSASISEPSEPRETRNKNRVMDVQVPGLFCGVVIRNTWTLQGVSNGLPHTTYRLPLGTPWRVLVYGLYTEIRQTILISTDLDD